MNYFKSIILIIALIVAVASVAEAHKKYYQQQEPERCVCDCSQPNFRQPVLPNRPFYGSAGYAQPPPSSIGYGGLGGNAVTGSYGSGGSQVSGGY